MTKRYSTFLRALFLALAVQFSLAGFADAQCLNSQQTRRAIQSKQVISIRQALKRANVRGRVVKAQLCPPNYVVTILDRKGNLRTRRIRATR